jgi:hypothetical protein
MRDKTFLYIFIAVILCCFYKIYESHERNDRLYKICLDQEEVIEIQNNAIHLQSVYIGELERLRNLPTSKYVY